jgi:uncharacterized DUF497 family protein
VAAYSFRWNAWNVEHISGRASVEEAEYVVENAAPPYPRSAGDEKFIVRGQTYAGRYIQVVYIFDPADVVYVIHARPLTENEKRQLRRSRR